MAVLETWTSECETSLASRGTIHATLNFPDSHFATHVEHTSKATRVRRARAHSATPAHGRGTRAPHFAR